LGRAESPERHVPAIRRPALSIFRALGATPLRSPWPPEPIEAVTPPQLAVDRLDQRWRGRGGEQFAQGLAGRQRHLINGRMVLRRCP
jgi:hypothetical protein